MRALGFSGTQTEGQNDSTGEGGPDTPIFSSLTMPCSSAHLSDPDLSGLACYFECHLPSPQALRRPFHDPCRPDGNILKNSCMSIFSIQAAPSHGEMLGANSEVTEARLQQSGHEEGGRG